MTSNNFAQIREELEKGCNYQTRLFTGDYTYCQKDILCVSCKTKLSLLSEIEKMIKEKINGLNLCCVYNDGDDPEPCTFANEVVLKELGISDNSEGAKA